MPWLVERGAASAPVTGARLGAQGSRSTPGTQESERSRPTAGPTMALGRSNDAGLVLRAPPVVRSVARQCHRDRLRASLTTPRGELESHGGPRYANDATLTEHVAHL